MMPHPQILMCPPLYYGIEYEINPWMDRGKPSDRDRATTQWQGLKDILEKAGATVHLMEPVPGLPDLVFTANAALIHGEAAVLSHFRHEVRQREAPHDEKWLAGHGFAIHKVPEDVFFEGAGDALFCGDTLYAGYRIRSDARGHQWIGEKLGCRVIPLELVDKYYYHLDTCFCPLTLQSAIYYPKAFDEYGLKALREFIPELIEVEEQEARHFACNAVVVGKHVVTNVGCPKLHAELAGRGFTTQETPLDEFVKAGGSAKCLTLRLDGEEAAAWKYGAA